MKKGAKDMSEGVRSMTELYEQAPWKALGWAVAEDNRSLKWDLQWLLNRRGPKSYGPLLDEFPAVVDHTVRLRDQDGAKVVVSSPYLNEAPPGFAEACASLGLSYKWLPPSESWYGWGTSRVEFRAISKH